MTNPATNAPDSAAAAPDETVMPAGDTGASSGGFATKFANRNREALGAISTMRGARRAKRVGDARRQSGGGRSRIAWAGQIGRTVASSVVRNTPLTLAAALCMAISLSMVGVSLLVASGVDAATERWRGGVETIVFLNPEASEARAAQVRAVLEENPAVGELEYVSQQDAYDEFSEMFANSPELVESVGAAALPSSWRVTPAEGASSDEVAGLADGLKTEDGAWSDGIYQVVYAKDAVASVMSVSSFARKGLLGIAGVLALCALVLTFAACRAAAWARRDELAVMRLVGAPRWLVRAPFMLEGCLAGLAGAFVAVAGVHVLAGWVEGRLETGSTVAILQYFSVDGGQVRTVSFLLLGLGALLGLIGAAGAVGRYVSAGDGDASVSRRVGGAVRGLRRPGKSGGQAGFVLPLRRSA